MSVAQFSLSTSFIDSKDGSMRVMYQTAEWSLSLPQSAHCKKPVSLGVIWSAVFETLTAARQISSSRWRYSVPAAQEGGDREDNKARPSNCLFRLNLSGHFVWGLIMSEHVETAQPVCLSLCLSNRKALCRFSHMPQDTSQRQRLERYHFLNKLNSKPCPPNLL